MYIEYPNCTTRFCHIGITALLDMRPLGWKSFWLIMKLDKFLACGPRQLCIESSSSCFWCMRERQEKMNTILGSSSSHTDTAAHTGMIESTRRSCLWSLLLYACNKHTNTGGGLHWTLATDNVMQEVADWLTSPRALIVQSEWLVEGRECVA